ncbi:MAG: ShlB/FhaC/HecB family hemolysin secretion/activation protein, partial [Cyanobacteria bacterium P01_H01_bin.15]
IFGFNVPLSPGANDNGQTDVSVFRFFQEWTQRSRFDVFTVRSEFNLGTGILGATVNSDPPDSRFLAWRSQGQYVRQLAPAMLLVARSDLQLSSRALPPLEQFSLGGFQSVRGYRQDARLTDNGFLGSVEIRLPVWKSADLSNTLQIIPFIDGGLGWSSSGFPNPDPNGLVGVGLGLQWQMVDRLRARFDWGIPLIELEEQNRTLQEQGLYFSLDYRLF